MYKKKIEWKCHFRGATCSCVTTPCLLDIDYTKAFKSKDKTINCGMSLFLLYVQIIFKNMIFFTKSLKKTTFLPFFCFSKLQFCLFIYFSFKKLIKRLFLSPLPFQMCSYYSYFGCYDSSCVLCINCVLWGDASYDRLNFCFPWTLQVYFTFVVKDAVF